jgi:hypothetical protein
MLANGIGGLAEFSLASGLETSLPFPLWVVDQDWKFF